MSSVMPGLMSIVLFTLNRSFPSDIRGVGHWASGSLIVSLAALLLAFRGAVPFWLSAVAANGMLILGLGLCNIGSAKFFGRPASWRTLAVLVAVGVGSLAWMGLVQPDETGRAAVISAILALLYGIQSRLLLRDGRNSIYCVVLGAMFLVQSVSAAVRCITCFIPGWANTDMFAHDTVQVVYLTVNGFMSLIITVGFVLVAMDRLRAKLERQSLTDPLTGLLNRRAFSSIHETERERMMRESSPLAMLIVDLDHFKAINDKHGHDVGDRVLMDFAFRVAGTLSPREPFARYGGEEFVILLSGVDADEAQAKAETIRRQVQYDTDRSLPTYTCSIGVACMKATDATLVRLHRVADEALYRAKSSGRNRVVVTDDLILL
ncbi:MAG TPA: diguanylate cyclase [Paraburkholderia sp.]|nr:diguanylate cyclase [Paraburkholderia sp.]